MCDDDGSSDRTYEIAENLQRADKRIVLLKNEHNLGLNITLNNCLKKQGCIYCSYGWRRSL
ncbi:MAG: glycosyltransferase [Eubacterium ramulus]